MGQSRLQPPKKSYPAYPAFDADLAYPVFLTKDTESSLDKNSTSCYE